MVLIWVHFWNRRGLRRTGSKSAVAPRPLRRCLQQYTYKGKTIVDVLAMSVEDAIPFFEGNRKITRMLEALVETGLPYICLGQPLSTFSGGERQRVKLAQNLRKKGNIYILDEPTTGLHPSDIENVMAILEKIVDRGNTVIVIEHNMDVMKLADHIIDIGPDGGTKGGQVVFEGSPEKMIQEADTITAQYLRKDYEKSNQ